MNEAAVNRIYQLLSDQFRVEPTSLTMSTRFIEDLSANSLDVVELLALIEGEYQITIGDGDLAGIKTVGDLVRLV